MQPSESRSSVSKWIFACEAAVVSGGIWLDKSNYFQNVLFLLGCPFSGTSGRRIRLLFGISLSMPVGISELPATLALSLA